MFNTNELQTPGIIGIGAMGLPLAQRLLRQGYAVRVRDIRAERESEARASGAIVEPSPASLGAACDVVITLVVNDAQTEEILFGPDGAIHTLREGSAVVMSSTLAPAYVERAARRLAARGIELIDAPISGGPVRAANGEMSMMLAAAERDYARCARVLAAMSNKIFRVSERVGDGARMKLVNNMLAAANWVAGCEALALGMKLGLDANKMLEVVGASSGASWIVPERMARALAQDFVPRAATTLLAKDVGLFLNEARAAQFETPMAQAAHAAFARSIERGEEALDDAVLIRQYLER
jgi:L-threonate 2-dehydrogenase